MYSPIARRILSDVLDVVAETIWPTRCAVCEISGEKVLCDSCEKSLMFVDSCHACPRCGAPFGRIQCTECNDISLAKSEYAEPPYERMWHAVCADDAGKTIVRIYKDHDEHRLAGDIARILARYVSPDRVRERCALTFIPATKAALRRRGFDHAEEICNELARTLDLDCTNLFDRPKSSDQRQLGRRDRASNMSAVMHVREDAKIPDSVIVIDDICTTGATIASATAALREAGAKHVYALTFGQVLD